MLGCCLGTCHPPDQSPQLLHRGPPLQPELSQQSPSAFPTDGELVLEETQINGPIGSCCMVFWGTLPPSFAPGLGEGSPLIGQVEKPLFPLDLGLLTLICYPIQSLGLICLGLMEHSSPTSFYQSQAWTVQKLIASARAHLVFCKDPVLKEVDR